MHKFLLISQGVLFLGLAVLSGLRIADRHSHPEKLIIESKGVKAEITADEARFLSRMARHTGLNNNAINVMYCLKYKPASVEFWKADKAYQDGVAQLLDKKLIFERNGLWELTHDGQAVVHDHD